MVKLRSLCLRVLCLPPPPFKEQGLLRSFPLSSHSPPIQLPSSLLTSQAISGVLCLSNKTTDVPLSPRLPSTSGRPFVRQEGPERWRNAEVLSLRAPEMFRPWPCSVAPAKTLDTGARVSSPGRRYFTRLVTYQGREGNVSSRRWKFHSWNSPVRCSTHLFRWLILLCILSL